MKRRAFLGFMGGAVAAGPKLATGIAENTAHMMPAASFHSGVGSTGGAVIDGDWKVRRIQELKAIIAGGDPNIKHSERMNRLYAMEVGERLRLDALRSVAPAHKQRMLIDGAEGRNRRIRQADAEWDLHRLLSGN